MIPTLSVKRSISKVSAQLSQPVQPQEAHPHDQEAYKGRNLIESCFGRLQDFRRIATRYDKLALNYFSRVCIVAAVVYWI